MLLEKTATPVLVKVYDSGEATLAKVSRSNEKLCLNVPETVSPGLGVGHYVSLFRLSDTLYHAHRVCVESLSCAEFFQLNRTHGHGGVSYMYVGPEVKKAGITMPARVALVRTPEGAYELEIQNDNKYAQDMHVGFLSNITHYKVMKVPFSVPCLVATYIKADGRLLMKPIDPPTCTGELLSTKIIRPGGKEERRLSLPRTMNSIGGKYVKIEGGTDWLQMEKVPDSVFGESGYDFRGVIKITEAGDNMRYIVIPRDVAERRLALEKRSWVRQHVNGEGAIELERFQIKTEPGTELIRVSKLYGRDGVVFALPARAVKALGLKKGDSLSVYDNHGRLKLVRGHEENARLLGSSEVITTNDRYLGVLLPTEVGPLGYDETTYVIVRLSENKIVLENADIEQNASVAKLIVFNRGYSETDAYKLGLSYRLRERMPKGNYGFVFEKRQ